MVPTEDSDHSAAADGGTTDDGRHDLEALRTTREEVRTVLDHQLQTINDVDTKAAKTSRLDAILLGLVLTAGSFLAQADAFSAGVYVNGFSLAGLLFVVGSFTLAVATYSTTDVRTGVGPADVQRLVDAKYSEREWLVLLLRSEARWMAENERRQARNASLLTASQAALIVGTTLLTAGVAAVHW